MEEWAPTYVTVNSNSATQNAKDDESITFQIWDFGGQELYHVTHQLFLCGGRCLFLVVFDLRSEPEASRVEYWLRIIDERAKDSPIILVGTHLDLVSEEQATATLTQLQSKYYKFHIKHVTAVSCKNQKNVDKLKDMLITMTCADRKIKETYPISFFQLENLILAERENRTPPLMTMLEFRRAAYRCGVKVEEYAQVLEFLVQLGCIIYYNYSKGNLEDMIILNPLWLAKLMSTLITTKPNFVLNGILPRKHLELVWRAPDYPPSLHHALMSLLNKFEICFPFPNLEKGFLIPALLPANRPVVEYSVPDHRTMLERIYTFQSSLEGFFSRLMVRLLYIMEGIEYWKNGVVLRNKHGTLAIVEFRPQLKQLQVCTWGQKATKYLRNIMESIDVLQTSCCPRCSLMRHRYVIFAADVHRQLFPLLLLLLLPLPLLFLFLPFQLLQARLLLPPPLLLSLFLLLPPLISFLPLLLPVPPKIVRRVEFFATLENADSVYIPSFPPDLLLLLLLRPLLRLLPLPLLFSLRSAPLQHYWAPPQLLHLTWQKNPVNQNFSF